MSEENKLVDITKLFFAVCVVAIHTQLLNGVKYGYLLKCNIYRLAVPFFFICSGFYLSKKIRKNNYNIKVYIKKYIKIYFIGSIFYTIMNYACAVSDFNILHFMNDIRDIFYFKTTNIMWYVGVLVLFSILIMHLKNKKSLKYILTISTIGYIIGLIFVTYRFHFNKTVLKIEIEFFLQYYQHNRYFLFTFIFPLIGFIIEQYNIINKIKKKWVILGLIISQILLLIETNMYYKNSLSFYEYDFFLFTPFVASFLFMLLNKMNINIKFSTKKIRILSAKIYYYHYFFILIYFLLSNRYQSTSFFILCNNHSLAFFICISSITIITSLIIIKLQNRKKETNKK